jgi:acetate kinase
MREVLRRADEGDPDGRLALGVYVHRLRRETGAMVASAGGLDALVFTGGVGEHAAAVRRRVCEGLAHLGVDLAPDDTTDRDGDREISSDGSAVRVLVVAAREELVMAEHVARVVRADGGSTSA